MRAGQPWLVGPQWPELRFRQPGWLVFPLRGFLAVTFIYAGLQKLANPGYLDPHNRASVVGQMQSLRHSSPIGPLLAVSLHAPTLVGLMIALGELAVGTGVLLGLLTRLAALGGMLLSLTFFLTVSWRTTPYYYGSDIVFLFAWTVLAGFGAGGVLSTDAWLRTRARQLSGVPAGGAHQRVSPKERVDLDRRTLLLSARTAAVVAVITGAVAGATAAIGRLAGGTTHGQPLTLGNRGGKTPSSTPSAAASPSTQSTVTHTSPPGTAIGPVSAVPVGQAAQFTDPATGGPAWMLHPTAGRFVAFSAVCTHAGCTVNFDQGSNQFVCPCHGGTFDAKTGQVLGGPPPSPLPGIPVHIVDGQIRVD